MLARFDFTPDELLIFRIEKTVDVQVWQVGLFYRTCQALVVLYVAMSYMYLNTWAMSEVPTGSVNPWPEAGDWRTLADLADYTEIPYCSNSSYDFAYSSTFKLETPTCVAMAPYELARTETNLITFTTSILAERQVGWPCAHTAVDATERAACSSRGGCASSARRPAVAAR